MATKKNRKRFAYYVFGFAVFKPSSLTDFRNFSFGILSIHCVHNVETILFDLPLLCNQLIFFWILRPHSLLNRLFYTVWVIHLIDELASYHRTYFGIKFLKKSQINCFFKHLGYFERLKFVLFHSKV